ncbi:hypothetical protein BH18ACT8_BH18ACT8_08570 [soil metagenome]
MVKRSRSLTAAGTATRSSQSQAGERFNQFALLVGKLRQQRIAEQVDLFWRIDMVLMWERAPGPNEYVASRRMAHSGAGSSAG